MLPFVMEVHGPGRAPVLAALAAEMGSTGDPVDHVHALGLQIGLPASLAEIGVAQGDLRGMAEASVGIKRLIDNNPRPLDADSLEAILDAAWHGDPARLRTPMAAA
jgi:alcohol dehydrogenase